MKSILSFVLLMSLPLIGAAQLLHDTPLIHVTGTSKVSVLPDEVHFNFSVITEGQDLSQAKSENKRIAQEVLSYLKKSGVEDKHIQTQYLNIGQRYRDWNRKEETKYYECSQTMKVCLKEIDGFELIIEGLLERGIHNLSSPDFRTSRYRELMDEAREKAVIAAREKAKAMANALGQDIGTAHTISEHSMPNYAPVMRGYANMAMDASAEMSNGGPGVATGEIEVRATVNVYFHLLGDVEKPSIDSRGPQKVRK